MTKKFLTSVANAFVYNDSTGALLAYGKTLLNSSIETALASTPIRGGYGNQLQYVYYHTAEMKLNIEDAQWNLDFLSQILGSSITTGENIYQEETITLDAGKGGSVTDTPLAVTGTTVYGWVTLEDGTVEKVTFSTKAFTTSGGAEGDEVCVRYYVLDAAARSVTVNANILPSIVRIVLEAQLNSSDSTTNQIGTAQIIIPRAQLTGDFTIKMTPDGVASTPLAATALANTDTTSAACDAGAYYAKIVEIITSANWYDNVTALAIEGGDFALVHPATVTLHVWAIPSTGLPFLPPVADLTFSSASTAIATVGANTGLVTPADTGGTSLIKALITSKNTIEANAVATVTT